MSKACQVQHQEGVLKCFQKYFVKHILLLCTNNKTNSMSFLHNVNSTKTHEIKKKKTFKFQLFDFKYYKHLVMIL